MTGPKDLEMTPTRFEPDPTTSDILSAAAHCVRTDDLVDAVSRTNTPLTLCKAQFENAGAYGDFVGVLKRLLAASGEEAARHPDGWCPMCRLTVRALAGMLDGRNMTLVTYRDEREKGGASSVTCDFDRESCSVYLDDVSDGRGKIRKLCAC